MAAQWYYTQAGQKLGPINSQQLAELAKTGRLQPTDQVWREDMKNWVQASAVKGLFPTPVPPPLSSASGSHPAVAPTVSLAKPWYKALWFRIVCGVFAMCMLCCGGLGGFALLKGGSDISMVKNGHLQSAPDVPLGKAIDAYLSNPKWTALKGNDGRHYVNVEGGITFHGKPATALIQFKIDKKNKTFEFNAFEIDGVPQNNLVKLALINKILAEYRNDPGTSPTGTTQPSAEITVTAAELLKAYAGNEVAADQRYKGKVVRISGKVGGVMKDLDGSIYVSLETSNPMAVFSGIFEVHCYFGAGATQQLAKLVAGQQVTLQGQCEGLNLLKEVIVTDTVLLN